MIFLIIVVRDFSEQTDIFLENDLSETCDEVFLDRKLNTMVTEVFQNNRTLDTHGVYQRKLMCCDIGLFSAVIFENIGPIDNFELLKMF